MGDRQRSNPSVFTAIVLCPSVIYGLASDDFLTWALGELREGNQIDIVDETTAVTLEAEFLVWKLDFAPAREEWQAALGERIETGGYGRR